MLRLFTDLNPQSNINDWSGFKTGTIECLGSIQGSGGVPSSYTKR